VHGFWLSLLWQNQRRNPVSPISLASASAAF